MKNIQIVFFCVIPFCSFSQSFFEGEKSISLYTKYFLTPNQEIQKDFSNELVDFYSKPLIGFEGELRLQKYYKDKLEIGIGIKIGTYPYDNRLFIDKKFPRKNETDWDLNHLSIGYEPIYSGLSIAAKYFFFKKNKTAFSAEIGFSGIYFLNHPISERVHVIDNNLVSIKVFETAIIVNQNNDIFLSGNVTLGVHRKLRKRIVGNISINGMYSNNYPIKGISFSVIGTNQILSGSYKKQFIFFGIEIGGTYFIHSKKE
jgi:hypothetical protein